MQRSVEIAEASAVLKAQIEDATHKGDAQDVDVPTSAVLEAQIAEATRKGDAQEVDVLSSAVLEAYAHDLPLPMTSYLTSQRCEVSCGAYPFGDPHGWLSPSRRCTMAGKPGSNHREIRPISSTTSPSSSISTRSVRPP